MKKSAIAIVALLAVTTAYAQFSLKRFIALGAVETITLSGTAVAPNMLTSESATNGTTLTWVFGADGTVTGDGQFQAGIEWIETQPDPRGSYWIRATSNAGDDPTGGSGLNTWLALTSSRTWSWAWSGDNLDGSIKIEIARDSSGSSIAATGYYGAALCDQSC